MMMNGVMIIEISPHHPKNNVVSVIEMNVLEMHGVHIGAETFFENRINSTPMF